MYRQLKSQTCHVNCNMVILDSVILTSFFKLNCESHMLLGDWMAAYFYVSTVFFTLVN